MKNITKAIILLMCLILLPVMASAQQTPQQESFSIISFDIGYSPFYSFDRNDYFIASTFGLNLKMSDDLSAGVRYIDETEVKYGLLNLKYQAMDQVRLVLGFGGREDVNLNITEMATGIGFEYVPFMRKYNGALSTEFKITVDYMMVPKNGVDEGDLFFGLSVGIGI